MQRSKVVQKLSLTSTDVSRQYRSRYSTAASYDTAQSRKELSFVDISVKEAGKLRLQSVDTDGSDLGKSEMHSQSKLLTNLTRKLLLESLQTDLRPEYRRRIEIMLLADMGYSQSQVCAELGCSQETARHWIAMAKAGQAHKWDDDPIGRPQTVSEQYLARLRELASRSPREYGYSFDRWTAQCLSKRLAEELGIEVSDRHINRLLKQMGISTQRRRSRAKKGSDLLDTNKSSITIGNLKSSSSPSVLWSFNLIKTSN